MKKKSDFETKVQMNQSLTQNAVDIPIQKKIKNLKLKEKRFKTEKKKFPQN